MRPFALALVLALVAGCFGAGATPNELAFSATGGKVGPGWAYDGGGIVEGAASLNGTLDNAANTGTVHVEFSYHAAPYVVHFASFAQAQDKAFQDGGVAYDLDEHGSTGNGDALLPKLHARAAAWGTATVTRAGLADERPWTAHLMLSEDTVRTGDGKISNAAGTAYDPAKPDDATVIAGQPQAIFFIKHPDGETATKGPVVGSAPLSCAAQCDVSTEVPVERGAEFATINVTLVPAQGPVAVGQGEVRYLDAEGAEVLPAQDFQVTPANAPLALAARLGADTLGGPITVRITGTGAFTATVDHVVEYDLHPFLVVTWDGIVYE